MVQPVAGAGTPAAAARPLPAFSELQGVLFDIDGTLVNSDPLHFDVFVKILVEKGFNGGQPIDEHFFRANISGRHNPDIAADLFPDWSVEQRAAFSEEKEQMFRRMALQVGLAPMTGLPAFLEWMRARRLPAAAVTNAPRENANVMLQALGITGVFETVVFGEECTRAKPFPDPYLEGLAALGIANPAQVLVFEDSPSGIAAAVAAELPVVALTSGHDRARLTQAGASLVVQDFSEVMALIESTETPAM